MGIGSDCMWMRGQTSRHIHQIIAFYSYVCFHLFPSRMQMYFNLFSHLCPIFRLRWSTFFHFLQLDLRPTWFLQPLMLHLLGYLCAMTCHLLLRWYSNLRWIQKLNTPSLKVSTLLLHLIICCCCLFLLSFTVPLCDV